MFQRVLFPTDGSDAALAAAEVAVRASAPDGEIVILAVIPSVEGLLAATAVAGARARSAQIAADLAERSSDSHRTEAREHLRAAEARVRALGGRVARTVVHEGEPGPSILAVARALGCDGIVMSTHGRSGWRRTLLGSVSDHVVRHADDLPVILVRRTAPD